MEWPLEEREKMFHQVNYQMACQIKVELIQHGASAKSVNRAMSAIRNVVKVGVLMGLVSENQLIQLTAVKLEKTSQHQGHPLNATKVTTLFRYLAKDTSIIGVRNQAIFAVLLGAGLRRSEVVALKLSDLALDEQHLVVRKGKGNKRRVAFLPKWCITHINSWLLVRGFDTTYMFNPVNKSNRINISKGISTESIYLLVRTAAKHAELGTVSPHDLRRTYITRLLEQNIDLNTVRMMAGHEDISTTVVYDKRDNKVMRQAASSLRYEENRESSE